MPAPAAALADDPHARFEDALARARTAQPYEASPLSPSSLDPTAMTLATVDLDHS